MNRGVSMIIIEVDKLNVETVAELKELFPECDSFEENSFGSVDLVNFVVPVITALAASPVLIKWIESNKLTIKHDNTEISGNSKQVLKALEKILAETEKENDD